MCRLCHGVAIHTRGNGGEVHAFAAICKSQLQAGLVAGAQQCRLTVVAAPPNRAGGVDHIAAGEVVGSGDLRLTRLAAAQCAALLQQLRPCGAVDRPIHAAAAQQRTVGGVDDGIHLRFGNVT